MGMYDTFGKSYIQLKVGSCTLTHYEQGDAIHGVADGVYVAPGGVVVIRDEWVVGVFETLHDKWGNVVNPRFVDANNPLRRTVDDIVRKQNEIRRKNKAKKKIPKFRLLKRKTISDR